MMANNGNDGRGTSAFHYVNGRGRMSHNEHNGMSRRMIDTQFTQAKEPFFRKDLLHHYGCVNSLEFSRDGGLLSSGSDDGRVLVWNVHKSVVGNNYVPVSLQAEHRSNVFAVAFDNSMKRVLSGGNDEQVIMHDLETNAPVDYLNQEGPVFGIDTHPLNTDIFSVAGDDGQLLIYDMRDSSEPFTLATYHSPFHSVMFHPTEPRLVLSANAKAGAALWDIRMPKRVLIKYGRQPGDKSCMNARFNSDGSQVLALRRRLPAVLYSTHSSGHLFQFSHPTYYNSCTMKSCSFGGINDEFVISGSDNFDIHIWKIPKEGSNKWVDKADVLLQGHRSIVNQVRYSNAHHIIASSGVEKIVKIWSPFPLPDLQDQPGRRSDRRRDIYTSDGYIRICLRSRRFRGHFSFYSGDTCRHTREDLKLLGFFDALVQKDLTGLSDDEDSDANSEYTNTVYSAVESSSSAEEPDRNSTSSSSDENDVVRNENASEPNDSNNQERLIDFDDLPAVNSGSETDEESDRNGAAAAVIDSSSDSDDDSVPESVTTPIWNNPSLMEDPDFITRMVTSRGPQLRRLAVQRFTRRRESNPRQPTSTATARQVESQGSREDSEVEDDPVSPFPLRSQRDHQMTPKYESSSNITQTPSDNPGTTYQLVNELMTRNLNSHVLNSTPELPKSPSSSSSSSSSSLSDVDLHANMDSTSSASASASSSRRCVKKAKESNKRPMSSFTKASTSSSLSSGEEEQEPSRKRIRKRRTSEPSCIPSKTSGSGTPSDSGIDISRGEGGGASSSKHSNSSNTSSLKVSTRGSLLSYSDSSDDDDNDGSNNAPASVR